MSGFSVDWLALREPHDTAARDRAWMALDLPGWSAQLRETTKAGADGGTIEIVDLACGSGANLRALAPRIGGEQRWRLVDHDPALLAALPRVLAAWAQTRGDRFGVSASGAPALCIEGSDFRAHVTSEQLDLAQHLDRLDFTRTDLITGSALLDLVSADWLQALLTRACGVRSTLLFALNVDGRTEWQGADADDAAVHALFSQHQLRDKGFGPALGARVATLARQQLAMRNYTLREAASDWIIDGAHDPAMVGAMVQGIADAACEQSPESAPMVQAWKARRLAGVSHCRLLVGHVELMALPVMQTSPGPTTGPGPSAPR